jgi:RND family efflux transporter MFP subunit
MFVHAPFDGTVISKDAEVGESIMPGGMGEASGRGSVVTIADLSNLEVDCDVKEDFISRVIEGQAAEIAVDAVPDRRYKGVVRKIIPMGDRARATIKVKVSIVDADSRLFPEMSGTVYFLPSAKEETATEPGRARTFVASSAVKKDAEGNFVWLVDAENRARRQTVTCGISRDDRTEILSGLSESDRVVVNPDKLTAGQLVKVLED